MAAGASINYKRPARFCGILSGMNAYNQLLFGCFSWLIAIAGVTWTQLPGPFIGPFNVVRSGAVFGAIAVSPVNPPIVLAGVDYGGALAARSGVYGPTDGGVTFTQLRTGTGGCPPPASAVSHWRSPAPPLRLPTRQFGIGETIS